MVVIGGSARTMFGFGLQPLLFLQAGHVPTVSLPVSALQYSGNVAIVGDRKLRRHLSDRWLYHLEMRYLCRLI